MGVQVGGLNKSCRCWVPLLGAIAGCHWIGCHGRCHSIGCHVVRCHGKVPLLGAMGCRCWVPFLGAIG